MVEIGTVPSVNLPYQRTYVPMYSEDSSSNTADVQSDFSKLLFKKDDNIEKVAASFNPLLIMMHCFCTILSN